MRTTEHLLSLDERTTRPWQHYLLDSVLASVGSLLVTAVIATWQLYPRIPNISIVYLLVVITLASTRGRYAAIFAAVVAFLAFDFFIVPPVFTFVMYRVEEWIALFVFLVDALLTGQLAAALRQRAKEATSREAEMRILYDLVRRTTREETLAQQLQVITQTIVDVFSSWGIDDCAILLPDVKGTLRVQARASQSLEQGVLSSDEQALAFWVMEHGCSLSMYDDNASPRSISTHFAQTILVQTIRTGRAVHFLRLLPLKMGPLVVGVLRLRLPMTSGAEADHLQENHEHLDAHTTFFWSFLDQAASLIERARLRRENMRIEMLQRTDELRAALLSSVSHDLRTPLTVIKAAASSLLQEEIQWDEEARRSFVRSIEREADRLNRLVGNLLDMSRIEDGALKPEKEWYQLTMLVQDVLDRLQPLLQGRMIHLDLPTGVLPVELDYLQIDQVLTNLLENALRYTPPESPIEIAVQEHGNEVYISVADRGPGIPVEDLERVFDKFYRVLSDKHYAGGSLAGSGLGLAVCKGLVEAHGGHIWARSRDGGGVVFCVALPVGKLEGSFA